MLLLNVNMSETIPSPIDQLISLRPVVAPDDDAFLEELYFSARDDLHDLFVDSEETRQLILMQQKAQATGYKQEFPNATYEVILFDGERAGRIVIDRSQISLAIIDIALLPSFRNRGIGSCLLDSVIEECRGHERPCELSVFKTNRAIKLYLRKGFSAVHDMETHFRMKWTPKEDVEVLEQFERDKFAEAIGSTFVLRTANNVTAEFVLANVSELHETIGRQGFSIEFLAPENCSVDQGLYDLEHATLGKMQLFLVPVGMKKGRLQLQSVFNLMIDDEANE
jgi:ribosomal protein S18 acetylase RimI-like enzyme